MLKETHPAPPLPEGPYPLLLPYSHPGLLGGRDRELAELEQGLRLEADLNFILQSTSDRTEGITSFLQRRTPEYRGE